MTAYVDIADLPEDERIAAIRHMVVAHAKTVAFVTDSDPGKAERYIAKLQRKFPSVVVLEKTPGPVPNTVTIRVGPRDSSLN